MDVEVGLHIYAWNDGEDDGGTQIRLLIITKESLGLRSSSRAAAAALNLWGIPFNIFFKHLFFSSLSLTFISHSIKRREEEEEKECDVHVIQQPLCSLFEPNILNHRSSSVVFFDIRGLVCFLGLIIFRSYIDNILLFGTKT